MGQKTYETNISILPAIEASLKKPHHILFVSFSRIISKVSVKMCPEKTVVAKRAKCKNKKIRKATKSKFTLVFNGCDWTMDFRGGLKWWWSRRNGKLIKTKSRIRTDRSGVANPLKKYGYILYHFLLVFKRFFSFSSPSPRSTHFFPSPRACSPLATISADHHPFITPFLWSSSVMWKSHTPLSQDVKRNS